MPHPIAATGHCSWCGVRALLYMRARDGSDAERPACRSCVERGCSVRAKQKNVGGFDAYSTDHRVSSVTEAENSHPMSNEQYHRAALTVQSPQMISANMYGECDPHSMCSPSGRLPMAVTHAPNDIVCRKRSNGGAGIDGVGVTGVYQCGWCRIH